MKELGVPIVSSEFSFPGQQGEENATILVTRGHLNRVTFAHLVTSKSCTEDPWMIEATVKDIESLGVRTIVYRTDNEPAALELQEKKSRTCASSSLGATPWWTIRSRISQPAQVV